MSSAPALAEPSASAPAAVAPAVVAPALPVFGERGQVVVTSAFALSLGYLREGGQSLVTFDFAPSAHYFVARHFSLGLGVRVRQSPYLLNTMSAAGGQLGTLVLHQTTFAVTGICGYDAPLGKLVSLWVPAEVGIADNQYPRLATPFGALGPSTSQGVWLELFAPFLVHPAPHFFVGLGPDLLGEMSLSRGAFPTNRVEAGVGSTVGGWF